MLAWKKPESSLLGGARSASAAVVLTSPSDMSLSAEEPRESAGAQAAAVGFEWPVAVVAVDGQDRKLQAPAVRLARAVVVLWPPKDLEGYGRSDPLERLPALGPVTAFARRRRLILARIWSRQAAWQ